MENGSKSSAITTATDGHASEGTEITDAIDLSTKFDPRFELMVAKYIDNCRKFDIKIDPSIVITLKTG
jgi:hypothetical protein